ncbi:uncharacterized protein BT62DRAFT_1012007 [Guyanagaster necrorhizus]|uniref:Uncharacterized protein n=1 Tax=Guyanagaster necrorhizus TaxID=856835 RepID=A0A9P7VIX6_9AGAR|nr:uncharacterized protein BT62DRAFT_1012007 [Guyanagaster necrorhizus MCA 3950]KAG7441195.1 hypothetical protein BT62DRAFT_1012007 [Guyanagaster necrorhizus MCA 3950]
MPQVGAPPPARNPMSPFPSTASPSSKTTLLVPPSQSILTRHTPPPPIPPGRQPFEAFSSHSQNL